MIIYSMYRIYIPYPDIHAVFISMHPKDVRDEPCGLPTMCSHYHDGPLLVALYSCHWILFIPINH